MGVNVQWMYGSTVERKKAKLAASYALSSSFSSPSAKSSSDSSIPHEEELPQMECLDVHIDGSCIHNGYSNARGGIGIWFGENDPRNHSESIDGFCTNNQAELRAAIRVLEIILSSSLNFHNSSPSSEKCMQLRIHSDSKYTVNIATKWGFSWESSNYTEGGKERKNADLVKRLLYLIRSMKSVGVDVTWVWVKGHAKEKGNEGAHRLATSATKIHHF